MNKSTLHAILKLSSRKFKFGRFSYFIFNNPDRLFNQKQKESLFEFTARMIQETFEKEDQSYFRARANYFGEITQYWLVLDDEEKAIGFCGIKQFEYQGRDAIYFDTINISRRYQANGIASIMVFLSWVVNSFRSRSFLPFAMRTQNPTVYNSIIRMVEPNILPEIDFTCEPKVRDKIFGLAQHVSAMLSKNRPVEYDASTSVCRAAYGRNLYGSHFKFSREDSVSRYFDDVLDRDAGDTMLVVVWPRATFYRLLRCALLMIPRSVIRSLRRRTSLPSGARQA